MPTSSVSSSIGARADLDLALAAYRPGRFRRRPSPPPPRRSAAPCRACSRNAASPSFSRDRVDDRPCPARTCSPASITLHFDESIMTGTRAMSGSAAISLQKRSSSPLSESSRPSSMLTSMTCAPFVDLLARDTTGARRSGSSRISFLNCAEPVTLVRSPTLTKVGSGVITSGSRPDRRV